LILALILALFVHGLFPAPPEQPDQRYREAYAAWMTGAMKTDPSVWFPHHEDYPLFRPLAALEDIGPNIVPFLVEELRHEQDRNRIYRLCSLLTYLSGIDLLLGKRLPLRGSLQEAYPAYREDFLAAWGSGVVTNPTESLRFARRYVDEDKPIDKCDYQGSLAEVRTSGIYALPFIVETLKQHNSDELFAAFLAVTGQHHLYSRYCTGPREMFTAHADKIAYVKTWFKANKHRIDRLSIYENLKKQLPEE